jgi:UDP-N-acetylglucosamine--N-acetylmuramyl-(pentapeptide) pyrophosphoryl-undecaprenol N-acetylglucosamine transferase
LRGGSAPWWSPAIPPAPGLEAVNREAAQAHFGLEPGRPVLLVTGRQPRRAQPQPSGAAALSDWLKDYQVIHLSGELDWAEVEQARASLSSEQQGRYHAFPFLHEMGLALAAADLVVSRAGASALGEYPLFGLPAILVPYPYAWRYQKVNADYLVGRGAAVRLNDEDLARDLGGAGARAAERPGPPGGMKGGLQGRGHARRGGPDRRRAGCDGAS